MHNLVPLIFPIYLVLQSFCGCSEHPLLSLWPCGADIPRSPAALPWICSTPAVSVAYRSIGWFMRHICRFVSNLLFPCTSRFAYPWSLHIFPYIASICNLCYFLWGSWNIFSNLLPFAVSYSLSSCPWLFSDPILHSQAWAITTHLVRDIFFIKNLTFFNEPFGQYWGQYRPTLSGHSYICC